MNAADLSMPYPGLSKAAIATRLFEHEGRSARGCYCSYCILSPRCGAATTHFASLRRLSALGYGRVKLS